MIPLLFNNWEWWKCFWYYPCTPEYHLFGYRECKYCKRGWFE